MPGWAVQLPMSEPSTWARGKKIGSPRAASSSAVVSSAAPTESVRVTDVKAAVKSTPAVLIRVRSRSSPVHPTSSDWSPPKSSTSIASSRVNSWGSNRPSTWATRRPVRATERDSSSSPITPTGSVAEAGTLTLHWVFNLLKNKLSEPSKSSSTSFNGSTTSAVSALTVRTISLDPPLTPAGNSAPVKVYLNSRGPWTVLATLRTSSPPESRTRRSPASGMAKETVSSSDHTSAPGATGMGPPMNGSVKTSVHAVSRSGMSASASRSGWRERTSSLSPSSPSVHRVSGTRSDQPRLSWKRMTPCNGVRHVIGSVRHPPRTVRSRATNRANDRAATGPSDPRRVLIAWRGVSTVRNRREGPTRWAGPLDGRPGG